VRGCTISQTHHYKILKFQDNVVSLHTHFKHWWNSVVTWSMKTWIFTLTLIFAPTFAIFQYELISVHGQIMVACLSEDSERTRFLSPFGIFPTDVCVSFWKPIWYEENTYICFYRFYIGIFTGCKTYVSPLFCKYLKCKIKWILVYLYHF
jgi:hypothetical protein